MPFRGFRDGGGPVDLRGIFQIGAEFRVSSRYPLGIVCSEALFLKRLFEIFFDVNGSGVALWPKAIRAGQGGPAGKSPLRHGLVRAFSGHPD